MSNRVDFYQSASEGLTLPAGRVEVFVDGRLCPYLEAVEVVRGGRKEFGWARLSYNPAAYEQGEAIAVEQIEQEIKVGSEVRLEQVYNTTHPGASAGSLAVFAGRVERIETRIGPEGEFVEIIARDSAESCGRVIVYGRWVADIDGRIVFLSGADTVFNEEGKGNCSAAEIEHNGNRLRMFAANKSGARAWSCADVINYLLREYLPVGRVVTPNIEELQSLTGGSEVRSINVTGLDLLEAIRRCCEPIGVDFRFVPLLCETGPEEAIVFYRPGMGRRIELNVQRDGEKLSISKTNVWQVQGRRNLWPVTTRWVGQGDLKVFEGTFDLVKAWDPALEDVYYDVFSPSTNSEFHRVKDVFRKWCLNEAGDYSGQPFNRGPAYDFSPMFGTKEYVHRRRRFWPALSTDKAGRSLGYYLEVTYNNGLDWWPYPFAFNNLLDECGIWLSSDRLDPWVWIAACKGVLKFRITASVVSDERINCSFADGPVGSTAAVVERLIQTSGRFKFRKVSGKSRFAHSADTSLGRPDEVDDSAVLYEYIRRMAVGGTAVIERFDVKTPYLCLDYQIGDGIESSPESRDIFSTRSDNRSMAWIERVRMYFARQCTELKVVRKRILDA